MLVIVGWVGQRSTCLIGTCMVGFCRSRRARTGFVGICSGKAGVEQNRACHRMMRESRLDNRCD